MFEVTTNNFNAKQGHAQFVVRNWLIRLFQVIH